ncbi:BTB/POZ domain-containing protein 2 [Aphelenchoides besseyi]|nr:BTB/POZ domain-containing protein 2 [Aphelenchoides besseyi]
MVICRKMDLNADNLAKKEETSSIESIDEPEEQKPVLVKQLNEFRVLEIGTDVTFIVGSKQKPIHAHKIILACCSDVFKAMFYGLLSEFPNRYGYSELRTQGTVDDEEENSLESVSSSISSSSSLSPESGRHSAADEEDADSDLDESLMDDKSAGIHEKIYRIHVTPQTRDRNVGTDVSLNTNRRYPPPIESVVVPDISPSTFRKLINFIYNDFDPKVAELNDQNIIETLYAAKKYAIDTLTSECVRYLLSGLNPSNAICLLNEARMFNEERLTEACLKVIDKNTDVAMKHISEADHDTLVELLKRTELDPSSELVIFEAALNYARAECERQQLKETTENLRKVLGSAFQLIRFPLMNFEEFGIAASSSLLTHEEISEVFLHLSLRPPPTVRFPTGFRCSGRSKHSISRFNGVSSKRYSKRESRVSFTADRDIQLYGVGVFGINTVKAHIDDENNTWSSQIEIQLAILNDVNTYSSIPPNILGKNTIFLEGTLGDETPLFAPFTEPINCTANQTYSVSMRFLSEGPIQTFCGREGKETVSVDLPFYEQVNFKFLNYRMAYNDNEKSEGQIPLLHFYVHWPKKSE